MRKNSEITHYQQLANQIELQSHAQNSGFNQSQMNQNSDLLQELESERRQKEKLQVEVQQLQEQQCATMKEHLETEGKDKFEIMFRSSVIQIEDILEKNLGNTRESMQKRQMWEEDVGALLNEYQIEV